MALSTWRCNSIDHNDPDGCSNPDCFNYSKGPINPVWEELDREVSKIITQARRHYTPTLVQEHIGPDTQHLIYHFENGYGASVIPEYTLPVSYNYDPIPTDRLELAVLKYNGTGDIHDDKNWSLCYNTPITNYEIDTLRNLTQDEVEAYLDQIANL